MHSFFLLVAVLVSLLLTNCAAPPKKQPILHPSLKEANLPEIIPIKEFFFNKPQNRNYIISPDGKKLAWLETHNGRFAIHYKKMGVENIQHVETRWLHIRNFYWLSDSRRFIAYAYQSQPFGQIDFQLYLIDPANLKKDPRHMRITSYKSYKGTGRIGFMEGFLFHSLPFYDPEHIFIKTNYRDKTCFDLYKVGIENRHYTLIAENPGDVTEWIVDAQGNLTGRIRRSLDTGKGAVEIFQPLYNSWRKVANLGLIDIFKCLVVNAEEKTLWALSNRNRDKVSLVRFNMLTGAEELIYGHPDIDITEAIIDPFEFKPLGCLLEPDYPLFHFFDSQSEKNFSPLIAEMKLKKYHAFRVLSTDKKQRFYTLSAYSETQIAQYFFDKISGEVKLLNTRFGSEFVDHMVNMKPIELNSRDGLELHGYLTLPKGVAPRNLPMVLMVHDGPWGRDSFGYNAEVQFLANRGYAVLRINYRGSTGYGKAFTAAGEGEMGGKMQDDLIDAVKWAVRQGIADEKHIAIYGRNYGGYTALTGLIETPELFACGIDSYGPTDLGKFMKYWPDLQKFLKPKMQYYIGDINSPSGLNKIKAKSPVYKAKQIQRPIFIFVGANNQYLPNNEAHRVVGALEMANKPYKRRSFVNTKGYTWNEKHGIKVIKTKGQTIKYYSLIEDFLAEHLGGRTSGTSG